MTMGTHMSIKAEAKNLKIFSLHRCEVESNPGGTTVG